MSIKVQSYVWENSKAKGSALLLLLAIADHAHDDGDNAYPSVDTLKNKCRQSERNVQRLLRELTAMGEIVIRNQAGPHGCNVYVIPVPWGANLSGVPTGVQGVPTGAEKVPQMSPEPLLTIKRTVVATTTPIVPNGKEPIDSPTPAEQKVEQLIFGLGWKERVEIREIAEKDIGLESLTQAISELKEKVIAGKYRADWWTLKKFWNNTLSTNLLRQTTAPLAETPEYQRNIKWASP